MENNRVSFKSQNIYLEDRKKLSVTGVEQVESFNENTIVLVSIKGVITIKGEGLNINKLNLDDGNVKIDGSVNEVIYSGKEGSTKGNLFEKMFK